jgi:hypothetical protein
MSNCLSWSGELWSKASGRATNQRDQDRERTYVVHGVL